MSVRRLVNLFSCFSIVPVQVHEVRDQIVEWGYYDSIVISPFVGPESAIRGVMLEYRTVHVYGAETHHHVIRYNSTQETAWQRLTCVKELIHSMDSQRMKVGSRIKLVELLDGLSLDGSINLGIGTAALYEEAAIYQAVAVLCPDEVVERYRSAGRSVAEFAAAVDLPEYYARVPLAPEWFEMRERLISFSE